MTLRRSPTPPPRTSTSVSSPPPPRSQRHPPLPRALPCSPRRTPPAPRPPRRLSKPNRVHPLHSAPPPPRSPIPYAYICACSLSFRSHLWCITYHPPGRARSILRATRDGSTSRGYEPLLLLLLSAAFALAALIRSHRLRSDLIPIPPSCTPFLSICLLLESRRPTSRPCDRLLSRGLDSTRIRFSPRYSNLNRVFIVNKRTTTHCAVVGGGGVI